MEPSRIIRAAVLHYIQEFISGIGESADEQPKRFGEIAYADDLGGFFYDIYWHLSQELENLRIRRQKELENLQKDGSYVFSRHAKWRERSYCYMPATGLVLSRSQHGRKNFIVGQAKQYSRPGLTRTADFYVRNFVKKHPRKLENFVTQHPQKTRIFVTDSGNFYSKRGIYSCVF